jgi:formylglycine-generating enzyme required for sulfatase activity
LNFTLCRTPEDGIYDLAGNVWEWTRSAYGEYPYDPADGREDTDTPESIRLVLRGGGWVNQSLNLRASNRFYRAPGSRNDYVGCRVARRLPEA